MEPRKLIRSQWQRNALIPPQFWQIRGCVEEWNFVNKLFAWCKSSSQNPRHHYKSQKMQPFAKFLPPADKIVEIFSFCSQGSPCNHCQWCYCSVTGHMGTPQPCLPPSPYRDTTGPNSSPSPCRDALDVFKLVPHGPQHTAHNRHVQTCSTWTSSYRATTHPLDM